MKVKFEGITKEYSLVLLAYLAIAMLMFWNLTLNFITSVPGYGGDIYQSMWNLWWVDYSLFTLHTTPYFTNLIYYPVGASLITQTMAPLAGIISLPFQLVSLPFALNVVTFLGFILSGLFMYLLAKHISGNSYGSFLAGVIFAFSPIHVIQSFGHLQWTNIEFIPLFILFFLMMIKEKRVKYAVYSSIAFILATFMGDVEQGIMLGLFAILILVYYLIFDKQERKKILSIKVIELLAITLVLVFIIGSPAFIPMLNGISSGALAYANQQATIAYNMLYSAPLLSFLLPAQINPVFSSISSGYSSIFAADPSERTAYIGYSVAILALLGLYFEYKSKSFKKIGLWLFLAIIFFLLALGPYVQMGNLPATTEGLAPSLYLAYHSIPIINVFREPGRFDFAVELSIAVLAAVGFAKASELLDANKKKNMLFALFLILILIEYWGSASPVIQAHIPKAYNELANIPGNYSVLILPALPNYTSPAPNRYPGVALYYQTALKKPIVGGYATRLTANESAALVAVPLIVESNYLSETGKLMYIYPINENYTNLTILMLAYYKVAFVSVIRNAYNQSQLLQLASYLFNTFGNPVYQSNSTMVFSTSNAITTGFGKSLVSYTIGNWFPGYYACTSYLCNSTFSNMWWGSNFRGVAVFAPANMTSVTMNFSAMYYNSDSKMYIYLNSPSGLLKEINLDPYESNYSVSMKLKPGLNTIFFATPNATGTTSLFNFGMMNITFSKSRG
ncbi:MAG: hypothetical protein ACP5RF_00335 [Candidatus Micrarchaeia archaeon]